MSQIYKIRDFSFNYPFQKSGIKISGEFEILKNDIVLLSGNSGSGKTTLLYALKGLIPKVIFGKMKGEIIFKNKDINSLSQDEKLRIGLVFQNPNAQMINKKVMDELAFGLENLRYDKREISRKIYKFAETFALTELLDRNITTLSGGEKQKIALISILLTEPDVMLFDEPTAFLDPESAKHFIKAFQRITKDKTVVIVEHNLNYLKNYVNKILEIKDSIITENKSFVWENKLPNIQKGRGGKIIFEIKNLSFAYNKKRQIIESVNLKLYEGEILGIIGKNGAGKTTLLKLMAKILKPQSGEIILEDKKNFSYKEYYNRIGLLFQNPENHFLYSTVEKETTKANLDMLGLQHLASHNPFTLSEGEKRRLSIAILLNKSPNILLMDEPTFGQDFENKAKLIDVLDRLKKQSRSVIIVSHDIPFLKAVADRIFTLESGQLYES